MIRIAHRINSIKDLSKVPTECGIELDLRSQNSKIILGHDFPAQGEDFVDFMASYRHKLIVLNVKEDGLEESIMNILNRIPDLDYFFLDQPIPTMLKSAKLGLKTSIRVSEFESLPSTPTGARWIWIDSFTGDWSHLDSAFQYAHTHKMRTCLVAPELQGRFEQIETEMLVTNYRERLDAVCTKNLSIWK